jgi:hypothetical protein
LFTATTPWKGNIVDFGLIFFPVIISILGIRFYVQRWVMYKSERGIHLTGGLLQTCTWWIYILGFVYTIIRKKVPYLPTPKEDKELTSWKIIVPNLFVGFLSIAAIIYGLNIDYTPFSLFMSVFALLNAFTLFYTLFFAYQKQRSVTLDAGVAEKGERLINRLQNIIFQVWRKAALYIIFIVLAISVYIQQDIEYGKWGGVTPDVPNKSSINYLGIFAPLAD